MRAIAAYTIKDTQLTEVLSAMIASHVIRYADFESKSLRE